MYVCMYVYIYMYIHTHDVVHRYVRAEGIHVAAGAADAIAAEECGVRGGRRENQRGLEAHAHQHKQMLKRIRQA